jgi:hypothetical protein
VYLFMHTLTNTHTHTLIYLSVFHTQTRTHIIPLYLFELRNCENVKVVSCAMSIFRKRLVRERVRDRGRDGEREGWRKREREIECVCVSECVQVNDMHSRMSSIFESQRKDEGCT